MSSIATKLVRPEILALTPYQSARRENSGGTIWLNANESPWNNSNEPSINRYPDCQPNALRQAYADYVGLKPEQILISRGADEGIELLIRTFCRPSIDSIATLTPSYGMYAISAATNANQCINIPWAEGYQLPFNLVEQAKKAKLVFVCNPNNPTGTVVPIESIVQLASTLTDALLVVDEAYIEFCQHQSLVNVLNDYPNLVILRTLSKAFALAGARCGFTLASKEIISLLEKVIAPYPIPTPVASLAVEALSPAGINTMQQQVKKIIQLRNAIVERLVSNIAIQDVLPSHTNYVLFRIKNAKSIQQALAQQGLLIRSYGGEQLSDWLRISMGTEQEIRIVEQAINDLFATSEQT